MSALPNTAAMTVNQAAQAVAEGQDLSCEELEQANQDARQNELDPNGTNGNYAVTTAVGTNANGQSGFMKSTNSPDVILPPYQDGYAGQNDQENYPECCGDGPTNPQRRNDSEGKMLAEFQNAGPGSTIKMNVFHQETPRNNPAGRRQDKMPCAHCKRAICCAEQCGITVILCNRDNEEVPAADLCENGQGIPANAPDATPYQAAQNAQQRQLNWRLAGF